MMGDDVPNCELNHLTSVGQHFGYPYWHEGTTKDPEFGDKGGSQDEYVAPAAKLGPHVAPLGIRFYEGDMFPSGYNNQIFIAKHGSWNRSKKSGYKITTLQVDGNSATNEQDFVTGWLDEAAQEAWGTGQLIYRKWRMAACSFLMIWPGSSTGWLIQQSNSQKGEQMLPFLSIMRVDFGIV